ncbi:MAG: hypothetical protein QOD93_3504 [Acetobacteraceae bacterium]|jgi:hypothetical protein|nr:hypothetical protein [Acetobacteraceae bacterium]
MAAVHDFSAPAFFAASSILPGSLQPPNGDAAVPSHQTVEIAVVPRTRGIYRVECTHFLHNFFGINWLRVSTGVGGAAMMV